jgi:hypothetical protein
VAETAGERCGYCLSAQRYVMGVLEVDEIAVEVRRNWILAGWHPPEE